MIRETDESFFSHITADEEKENTHVCGWPTVKPATSGPPSNESVPATVEASIDNTYDRILDQTNACTPPSLPAKLSFHTRP